MSNNLNPIRLTNPNYNLLNSTSNPKTVADTEKINIDISNVLQNTVEKFIDVFTKDKSVAKEMSDLNAINFNKIGGFANNLENVLTDSEFKVVAAYLHGQKLSDIIDKNGNLKPIDLIKYNNKYMQTLDFNTIETINNKISSIKVELNDTIKDSIIVELVSENSGYNAVVLKTVEGDYMLCSSPTNPESNKDLSAISYTLGDYLFDDTLAKYIPQLFFKDNTSTEDYLNSLNSQTSEDDYYAQIDDCYELIEKYCNLAKDENTMLNLFGFSLGGGITTTTYGLMNIKDSDLTNNINSVSVYNPYLLYADSYNKFSTSFDFKSENFFTSLLVTGNPMLSFLSSSFSPYINGNTIMEHLKNDEKLTIYSAESDIISTINDYVGILKDRFIFLPAKDIKADIKSTELEIDILGGIKDFVTGKDASDNINVNDIIDNSIHNIKELYAFIIKGKGNHGFDSIEDGIFDENGNIIKHGEYQNINELFASLTNSNYSGSFTNKPDLPFILNTIFKDILPGDTALNYQSYIFNYLDFGEIDLSKFDFKSIIEYICNNAGNFNEDEFINVVADAFEDWLTSSAGKKFLKNLIKSENEYLAFLVEYSVDEAELQEDLVKEIKKLLKKDNNYELTIEAAFLLLNNDYQGGMDILVNSIIMPNLDNLVEDNADLVISTLQNAITDYLKSNTDLWNWVVDAGDWLILDPFLDDIAQLLEDNPWILEDIIDDISKNGFNIINIIEIIEPIVNEREFDFTSLISPFNSTDILGFDVEYKTLYKWLSTIKWAIITFA